MSPEKARISDKNSPIRYFRIFRQERSTPSRWNSSPLGLAASFGSRGDFCEGLFGLPRVGLWAAYAGSKPSLVTESAFVRISSETRPLTHYRVGEISENGHDMSAVAVGCVLPEISFDLQYGIVGAKPRRDENSRNHEFA